MVKFFSATACYLLAVFAPVFASGTIYIEPEKKSADGFLVTLGAGANIAGKSELRSQDTLPSFVNFTGNVNVWYGNLFNFGPGFFNVDTQVGLFLGYVPVMTYKDDSTGKRSSDVKLPIILDARFVNKMGFFAGVGGGYAHTIITTIGITEATGPAAVISALLGWEMDVGYNIYLGVTLRAMYFLQQLENTNGSRSKNNQLNIQPLLQVGYKF